MTPYSIESKDQISVKGYEFFFFTIDMSKIIGKNIIKCLNGKYSQKLLDQAKKVATDALKTISRKEKFKEKTAASGDLIGNKIANKITNVSRTPPQNSLGRAANETESIGLHRKTSKYIYLYPEKDNNNINIII